MKKLYITIFICISSFFTYSQCSITQSKIDDDIAFMAKAESIYRNADLENGILGAWFQLIVIQNGANANLLMFGGTVQVMSSQRKPRIVPREILFLFEDNSSITSVANTLNTTIPMEGIINNECRFNFPLAEYLQFQTKKIKLVIIKDTRLGEEIRSNPFSGLIQEQANCLANKIKE